MDSVLKSTSLYYIVSYAISVKHYSAVVCVVYGSFCSSDMFPLLTSALIPDEVRHVRQVRLQTFTRHHEKTSRQHVSTKFP